MRKHRNSQLQKRKYLKTVTSQKYLHHFQLFQIRIIVPDNNFYFNFFIAFLFLFEYTVFGAQFFFVLQYLLPVFIANLHTTVSNGERSLVKNSFTLGIQFLTIVGQ